MTKRLFQQQQEHNGLDTASTLKGIYDGIPRQRCTKTMAQYSCHVGFGAIEGRKANADFISWPDPESEHQWVLNVKRRLWPWTELVEAMLKDAFRQVKQISPVLGKFSHIYLAKGYCYLPASKEIRQAMEGIAPDNRNVCRIATLKQSRPRERRFSVMHP